MGAIHCVPVALTIAEFILLYGIGTMQWIYYNAFR
jgi:hypothetical protein